MTFTVVIPARYQSSRLPGKPLVDIVGKTMIERVYTQACLAGAERVIVATDDERIASVVRGFGGDVCMTSPDHQSGTERLAEVVQLKNIAPDTIVVNVQGDEPLIPPQVIKQVAKNLHDYSAPMATLGVHICEPEEVFNPNAVKVVTDKSGYALYFSRASIPWDREHFANQQ
ncbi:MAG: 3-deoxy-manno-octulosonate cytidylyltransferase, partial [Vibrio sp.]